MYERDADLLQLEPRPLRRRPSSALPLSAKLRHEIQLAKSRVYRLYGPTPLEVMQHPTGMRFHLKREDLSPVHSYKWRGAMNRLTQLASQGCRHVVCASAGNHSQGVA